MSEHAHIKSTRRISKIWIIPILVIIVGGWMVYTQWKNQEVVLHFLSVFSVGEVVVGV